jgi:hypothetical protein
VFLLLHSKVVLDQELEVLGGLALGNGGFDLVVWGREGVSEYGRKDRDTEEKISNGLLLLSPSPSLPPSLPPSLLY